MTGGACACHGAYFCTVAREAPAVRVIDAHGDVWTVGEDGLMHTPETRAFPLEYVAKKWGPLRPA